MAMLAERKHKQKWSLNPRGKDWSDALSLRLYPPYEAMCLFPDTNKFGQKLMEKMGWKTGKGLGAKLDGMTEHVKVSYKHDSKGMGYKEDGEQWTQHEENFSKLLKSLGENSDVANCDVVASKSLEEISANSKKRVHYHKFTRGKDLTQYSEQQLANIFGKKTLKSKKSNDSQISETSLENGNKKKYGVDTVEGGSMVDYFKNKLGGKFKSTGIINGGFEVGNNGVLRKIKEIKNKESDCESESELERPSFGFGFTNSNIAEMNYGGPKKLEDSASSLDNEKVAKKSKKRKLHKDNIAGAYDNVVFNDSLSNSGENVEENPFEVKPKIKKIKGDVPPENFEGGENEREIKKKKSKNYDVGSKKNKLDVPPEIFEGVENEKEIKRKKSKNYDVGSKKNKLDVPPEIFEGVENEKEIKRKKSKNYDVDNTINTSNISDDITNEKIVRRKKKKNNKVTPIIEEEIINNVETKMKQKKSKKNSENLLNSGNIADTENSSNMNKEETPSKKKSKQNKSICAATIMETSIPEGIVAKNKKSENQKSNPSFDFNDSNLDIPMETSVAEETFAKKKSKKQKNYGLENPNFDLNESINISADISNEFEVKRKSKKDKMKRKLGETCGLDNPALNVSANSTEGIDESYQEGLSTSMQQNLFQGIENLALNVSVNDSIGDCNSDVIECELMLNVAELPHSARQKERERRKSVRFSDRLNKEYIIPNNYDNKIMEQKIEGLANAAFDERALTLQENLVDIEQQLSTDCAKVENDLNEVRAAAHARLLVPIVPSANNTANICHGNAGVRSLPTRQGGRKINKKTSTGVVQGEEAVQRFPEVGEPDLLESNQVTTNGDIRLAYKLASLKVLNVPPYVRKLPKTSDRASYKHLIKGDIIVGFTKSNLHEIDGYGTGENLARHEEERY